MFLSSTYKKLLELTVLFFLGFPYIYIYILLDIGKIGFIIIVKLSLACWCHMLFTLEIYVFGDVCPASFILSNSDYFSLLYEFLRVRNTGGSKCQCSTKITNWTHEETFFFNTEDTGCYLDPKMYSSLCFRKRSRAYFLSCLMYRKKIIVKFNGLTSKFL